MAWVNRALTSAKTFVGEVGEELKKSSWPTKEELMESSFVVIISVVGLGAFVAFSDLVLIKVIQILSGVG